MPGHDQLATGAGGAGLEGKLLSSDWDSLGAGEGKEGMEGRQACSKKEGGRA